MNDYRAEILEKASKLDLASRRVNETFRRGGRRNAEWEAAVPKFHEAMSEMYDQLYEDAEALRAGDSEAVEKAIQFLEADPWCFRSGYMKETLLGFLYRVTIGEEQARRLRKVILAVLDRGDRREFRQYARLAVKLRHDSLRDELLDRLRGDDAGRARRALWVLSRFPDMAWTDSDVAIVHELLVTAANDADWWRVGRWVELLATRFWSESFERDVLERATSDEADRRRPALRLISGRRVTLTDEQRARIGDLLIDVVERGGDGEEWLEGMAATIVSDELRARLRERHHTQDPEVYRRAHWALNYIRRAVDRKPPTDWDDVP